MYSRYVPQPDGTFQRSRFPDHTPSAPPPSPSPVPQPACPPPEPPPRPCPPPRPRPRPVCREPEKSQNISAFFRNLLPKDFDTGDLFVILLLLLICGDCQEDQNTLLLTLALYLFM